MSHFFRAVEFLEASSDLSLVNCLLWRALQSKLYRQDYGYVDHLKRVQLHLHTVASDKSEAIEGVLDQLLKERRWCLG